MSLSRISARRHFALAAAITLFFGALLWGVPAAMAARPAPPQGHSGPAGAGVLTDTTAPPPPQTLAVAPQEWTRINSFTFSWVNPNDPSGIAGAYYRLDTAPTGPSDGTFVAVSGGASEAVALSFTGLSQGLHTVYFWLVDGAGNVDHTARAAVGIKFDTTPPSVPAPPQAAPTGWTNRNNFTLTVTQGSDALSGIGGTWYKITRNVQAGNAPQSPTDGIFVTRTAELPDQLHAISGVQVPGEGTWAAWVWLQDRAGNANHNNNNKTDGLLHLDQTAPGVSAEVQGIVGGGGWYVSPVTVTASAADQAHLSNVISAIAFRVNSGGWVTQTVGATSGSATRLVSTDGSHTVRARASDGAGNLSPAVTRTFGIDLTPPTVAIGLAGTLGNNGWYTSTVVGSATVNDALSGAGGAFMRLNGGAWQPTGALTVTTEGAHTIGAYGVDVAGNASATVTRTFKLDSRPPTINVQLEGARGTNGWFTRSPVTVTLVPTDAVSGVAQTFWRVGTAGNFIAGQPGATPTQFVVNASDGEHIAYFYSVDQAGNRQTAPLTVAIKIDSKAPTIIPITPRATPPGLWSKTNAFTVTWTANPPDTSGIGGAYYKIGSPPTSNSDFHGQGNSPFSLRNIQLPGQGRYRLYLWLYDQAGNSDYRTFIAVADDLLLDQTAPTTRRNSVESTRIYTAPVTLVFTATDQVGLSGVAETRYQLNGQWATGSQVVVTQDGRNTINYQSVDTAGNLEPLQTVTVNLDRNAPTAPGNLSVTGANEWQRAPNYCYRVTWTPPSDPFGIAGSYYRIGAQPTSNADGSYLAGRTASIDCLPNVPEGKNDLYIWLRDVAGNADPARNAALLRAIWWDPTPPTSTLTMPAPTGQNGWYTSTITVTLSASDGSGSGLERINFRLDGGPWQSGSEVAIRTQGTHTFEYSASDVAGNVEVTRTRQIKLDTGAPSATIQPLSSLQTSTSFVVRWRGEDGEGGSGVARYDVQVKDGTGPWTMWQQATQATQATFQGERGHVYFFRVRARDNAGWVGSYATDANTSLYAFIYPIENGDFSRNLAGWSLGNSQLDVFAVARTNHEGQTSAMALLGNPSYADVNPNGQVPIGAGQVIQTIRLPSQSELPGVTSLKLSFWYNIWTCDSIVDRNGNGPYDSFDVTLTVDGTATRVLRDGNSDPYTICYYPPDNPALTSAQNLGWRQATIDLSAYKGKSVTLTFANWNRADHNLNTWTYVDSVTLVTELPCRLCQDKFIYIPLILRAAGVPGTLEVQSGMVRPQVESPSPTVMPAPPPEQFIAERHDYPEGPPIR